MTVSTLNVISGPYAGNGGADEYSYTFRVNDKTQLSVYETNNLGMRTLLTVDTDYTVNDVGVNAGGTITRLAGDLPNDYTWYIRSNYIQNQLTEFSSQGGFFPDVHENQMDHLTFLIQQLDNTLARSFSLAGDIAIDGSLTIQDDAAARASQRLGFDGSGNLIVVSAVDNTVSVTPFMATLLDDPNAFQGRITLFAAGLNDANTFTQIQRWSKSFDIPSSTVLPTPTDGNYADVTGTVNITSVESAGVGTTVRRHFDDVLTLTHHATNLILPGGADIVTAPGDHADFFEYSTGQFRVTFHRAKGVAVKSSTFSNNTNGNPNVSDDRLTVHTVISDSAWGSIGPTGGGTDVIWSALDDVPENVDWIEIKSIADGVSFNDSIAVQRALRINVRGFGSSEIIGDDNIISNFRAYTNSSGHAIGGVVNSQKIQVNNLRFETQWSGSFNVTSSVYFILVGFGYNQ